MIDELIPVFDRARPRIRAALLTDRPEFTSYRDLFALLTDSLRAESEEYSLQYRPAESEDITVLDHGDWQGTLLLTIPVEGYQPRYYLATKVSYGSCSACDALQSANEDYHYDEGDPNVPLERAKALEALLMHMFQQLVVV